MRKERGKREGREIEVAARDTVMDGWNRAEENRLARKKGDPKSK